MDPDARRLLVNFTLNTREQAHYWQVGWIGYCCIVLHCRSGQSAGFRGAVRLQYTVKQEEAGEGESFWERLLRNRALLFIPNRGKNLPAFTYVLLEMFVKVRSF